MDYRVDIVVPVYNEAENFAKFYDFLKNNVKSDWRILAVYDFPEDATLKTALPISQNDKRVRLILNPERGALNAVKTGFRNAECDAVMEAMVDDPPGVLSAIDGMVEMFYGQKATIVAASRYMRGGSHQGGPLLKGMLSRLAGISLHWLIRLPAHDATYNTRLYRRSFLNGINIESKKGFEIALELTIKAHLAGEKITEVPVAWEERAIGTSKFKILKWLSSYLYWYWYGIKNYWSSFAKKS